MVVRNDAEPSHCFTLQNQHSMSTLHAKLVGFVVRLVVMYVIACTLTLLSCVPATAVAAAHSQKMKFASRQRAQF